MSSAVRNPSSLYRINLYRFSPPLLNVDQLLFELDLPLCVDFALDSSTLPRYGLVLFNNGFRQNLTVIKSKNIYIYLVKSDVQKSLRYIK
ncbi:hypothetical protein XENTR_v10020906 [Xenopus tropicalis]|nr:hypothetical protein XENTR_v10020906 [Xenopus tropicalis]